MTHDTDLLPDVIYACKNNEYEVTAWFETASDDDVAMGYTHTTKYIRADLVSTPSSTRANERGDLSAAVSEIIKVAAILATREYCVSDDPSDYGVKVPASVLHQIRKQNERLGSLAIRLKKSADKLREHTPQPSPQSDMVAVPREVVEKIASAMTIAKATIKIWHDMGLKKYDSVFEFYERNSPEMKTINEAITMLQPYTKGE